MIAIAGRLTTLVATIVLLLIMDPVPAATQTNVPSGSPTTAPGTSVNVGVADTSIVLSGCASPNAFLQIFREDTPVGTVTADSQGRFLKRLTVSNDDAGLHTFKIFYQDANNRTSSVISRNVSLSAQNDTSLDLLLPTTIEHEPEPVVVGNYLIFRGSTCPSALVNVNLDNNLTLAAKADSRGNWYVIANTDNYYKGGHVYEALSSLSGQISDKTQKHQFNVTGEGQAPGEPPAELTPPLITEPDDLFLSGSESVTVRGTGPLNAQIEIFIDGGLAGSVFTNPLGEWSYVMKLDKEQVTVTARSCYRSQCGEFGNSVRIRYGGDLSLCGLSFRLADYRFFGVDSGDGIDLSMIEIDSAQGYSATIDWGDAAVERLTLDPDGLPTFHHVYHGHGQYNGTITVADDRDCQSTAYFSVLVAPSDPPNWWMLGAIPLGGGMIYLVSSFVSAYGRPTAPALPRPKASRPAGWPGHKPWPKPAYGAEAEPASSRQDQDKVS